MSIEQNPPKGLLFDVFGTCTDWRGPVPLHLSQCARSADPDTASKLSNKFWEQFTDEWRTSYWSYCHGFKPGKSAWRDIDTFHHESLVSLLDKHSLSSLWTPAEVKDISFVWHKLDGWPDSGDGIRAINSLGIKTGSLSNGNTSLLEDLSMHADLPFTKILSAEHARTSEGHHAYKPDPIVYRYGTNALGFKVEECALVAAHLGDLRAAKAVGLRTIYVERTGEEVLPEEEIKRIQAEGWVDIWIEQSPPGRGFLSVAERLSEMIGRVSDQS